MSASEQKPTSPGGADDPPPILGSWRALYLALILELALITIASCLLTWWAS
jgi:hypothetical protein